MRFEELIYGAQLKKSPFQQNTNSFSKNELGLSQAIPVKCQISGIKCPNSTIKIIRAKNSRNTRQFILSKYCLK